MAGVLPIISMRVILGDGWVGWYFLWSEVLNYGVSDGYIVEVRSADGRPIECGRSTLWSGEVFIGYFWQMTGRKNNGEFTVVHLREVKRISGADEFLYGRDVEFNVADVRMDICALRVPL